MPQDTETTTNVSQPSSNWYTIHPNLDLHGRLEQVLQSPEEKAIRESRDPDQTVILPRILNMAIYAIEGDLRALNLLYNQPSQIAPQYFDKNQFVDTLTQMREELDQASLEGILKKRADFQASCTNPEIPLPAPAISYLNYFAPMALILFLIHIPLYLQGSLYTEQTLPGVREDFWGSDQFDTGYRILRHYNWYISRLQTHPKASTICGTELLARNGRFKRFANHIAKAFRYRTVSDMALLGFSGSLWLFAVAGVVCLTLLMTGGLSAGIVIAGYATLSLPGVSVLLGMVHMIGRVLSDRNLKAACQVKPYLKENETYDPELKIRARAVNTIWTALTTPKPQPYQETAHTFYVDELTIDNSREKIQAAQNLVPRYFKQALSLLKQPEMKDIYRAVDTFRQANDHFYTADEGVRLLELAHTVRELVIRRVLQDDKALADPDTEKYCEKLIVQHNQLCKQDANAEKLCRQLLKSLGFNQPQQEEYQERLSL